MKEDLFKLKDPNYHESIGILPKWRVGDTSTGGNEIYPYYDADQCEEILDSALGVDGWGCEFREVREILFCTISIKIDGEIIEKADAGGERVSRKKTLSDEERKSFKDKTAASDAFVRASAKWGIGRHLSLLPKVVLKSVGGGAVITPDGTTLSNGAELSAWCNKITPSMRYLIAIYQLNRGFFDGDEKAKEIITKLKQIL